jgi:hypothetical protein
MPSSTDLNELPSFYRLLEGAKSVKLGFWFHTQNYEGPVDPADARLSPESFEWCSEDVKVVDLGEGRYRLADKPDLGALTEINWGDEFYAEPEGAGLEFIGRVQPRRFRHEIWIMGRPITPDSELSKTIHSLGGGWLCVMGGLCTVTLPEEAWEVFKQIERMHAKAK